MKVYAFDFDGTLTTGDTFVEFIRYGFGTRRMLLGMLLYAPLLVLMKMGLYPNWKAKQRVFAHFYKGMKAADFDDLCRRFARDRASLIRPQGMQRIADALREGSKVMIVSASIDRWVRPFFQRFADDIIVSCTQIDVRGDVLTGKFLTQNCYGEEKVKRIQRAFPYRKAYTLVAFGDSKGDREMLRYADEAHYKPFGSLPLKSIYDNMDARRRQQLGEIVRFGIVGATATIIQAVIYLIAAGWLSATVSNTIAYLVSFIFNYIASTRFTFRVQSTAKRGVGFAFSHVVNYLLQTASLNLFIYIGLSKQWALLPMFALCIPVNFLLVRYFLKRK